MGMGEIKMYKLITVESAMLSRGGFRGEDKMGVCNYLLLRPCN